MTSNNVLERRQREAVLADLARNLRDHGSWCGETHMQKASYMLEVLCDVPLGLGHVLYKYGPYSASLSDELLGMRADGLIDSEAVSNYGPRLVTTQAAVIQLFDRWPRTVARFKPRSEFIASRFASKGVGELERLATALWVKQEAPGLSTREQAERLHQIKPHVSLDQAESALSAVASWEAEAARLQTSPRRGRASTRRIRS